MEDFGGKNGQNRNQNRNQHLKVVANIDVAEQSTFWVQQNSQKIN